MELQPDNVLANIHNCTPEAYDFIEKWFDESPYLTAHTSGSTGRPKPISLLKSDMKASAMSTNRFFRITEKSRLLCPLSADYIAGKMMIVRAIVAGAQLWMEAPSNTPVHSDYGQVDLIAVVPSQVPHILSNPCIFNNIKYTLIGGAQLSTDLSRRIVEAKINAYVSYGMTETCSHVALRKVDDSPEGIYEAMPDIYFTKDSRGCLIVRSDSRSFKELRTNDIVNLSDERHFSWKGRIDNVINSGGIKVYPEEIEMQLHPIVPHGIEFYVAGCSDEKWGEVPAIILSTEVDDMDKLLADARNRVKSKAQRPVRIIVSDIRHTLSGKIIRERFI